jgi:hypothetical protein
LEIGSLGFSSPQQDFKRRQKFVFAASLRSVAAEFESSQP